MAVDPMNEILNYIGIVMAAILPVVVLYYFKVIERKRSDKEARIANDLKLHNERIANDLKLASAGIADELRTHLDVKIADINESIEELGKRIDLINSNQTELSKRVDSVTEKQAQAHKDHDNLISDLQRRADLTNGNIKNIRDDLMDLQEALDDILDSMKPVTQTAQNSRKKGRRLKRRRISADSDDQTDSKHRLD